MSPFLHNALTKARMIRVLVFLRHLKGHRSDHLLHKSTRERFEAIYEDQIWLMGKESGSLSGLGSELAATSTIRDTLPSLFRSINTQVVLDVGCGDFNWMKSVPIPVRYIGVDIVKQVIEQNTLSYGDEVHHFMVLDAINEPLPSADTILCREVLFHLSFKDIKRLIANVKSSGARYLITTTDTLVRFNPDIISGDHRSLNLNILPFHFCKPISSIPDDRVMAGRTLSLWAVSDLPVLTT